MIELKVQYLIVMSYIMMKWFLSKIVGKNYSIIVFFILFCVLYYQYYLLKVKKRNRVKGYLGCTYIMDVNPKIVTMFAARKP